VRPLPDLPDRGQGPDLLATRCVWTLIFLALGTGLIAARPSHGSAGWVLLAAGVSYLAAGVFFFQLVIKGGRR
jgi:hypothetical protein